MARRIRLGPLFVAWLIPAIALAQPADNDQAQRAGTQAEGEHADLGQVGAKLSNPLSDIWALF